MNPDNASWPDNIGRAAYRTVQEALTNASKHAPGAAVTIRITHADDTLRVEIYSGPPPLTQTLFLVAAMAWSGCANGRS